MIKNHFPTTVQRIACFLLGASQLSVAAGVISISFPKHGHTSEYIIYVPRAPQQSVQTVRSLLAVVEGSGQLLSGVDFERHVQVTPSIERVDFDRTLDPGQRRELAADLAQNLGLAANDVQVTPNYRGYLVDERPNDPRYDDQVPQLQAVGLDAAWKIRTGTDSVKVAILDSGIYYDHPDLKSEMARNNDGSIIGFNFVGVSEENSDPDTRFSTLRDVAIRESDGSVVGCGGDGSWRFWESHGTKVAGIIGAEGNNEAFGVGTAWTTKIIPVRIADENCRPRQITLDDFLQGLDFALGNGADIINASLAIPFTSDSPDLGGVGAGDVRALTDLIEAAEKKNVMIVAAAGNDGKDLSQESIAGFPWSYANRPNVVIVAASSFDNKRLWDRSDRGEDYVHVAAPGVSIFSTSLILSLQERQPIFASGTILSSHTGTSFAAPRVSAILALMKAEWPDASAQELKQALLDSCERTEEEMDVACKGLVRADLALARVAQLAAREPTSGMLSGSLEAPSGRDSLGSLAEMFKSRFAEEPLESVCADVRAMVQRPPGLSEELYSAEIKGLCAQMAASATESRTTEQATAGGSKELSVQGDLSESDLEEAARVAGFELKAREVPGARALTGAQPQKRWQVEVPLSAQAQAFEENLRQLDPEAKVLPPSIGTLQSE